MRVDPDTGVAEFCRDCKHWRESVDFNELKLDFSGYCLRYVKNGVSFASDYRHVKPAAATHWCSEFKRS